MGAGRGTLLRDIILTLQKLSTKSGAACHFLNKASFNIIEISDNLQKIQGKTLQNVGVKINWYKNFEDFSITEKRICFVANELFDCFPIHQFIKIKQGWSERVIQLKNDELEFSTERFSQKKSDFIQKLADENELESVDVDDVFEYSSLAEKFMQKLARGIEKNGGVALIIDYGYFKNPKKNTLQAVRKHKYFNVLKDVGDVDISALVDFPFLEKISRNYSLKSDLTTQREFFINLGIEKRKEILLRNKHQKECDEIASGINRIISKNGMGELFKCFSIWKDK
jgi:SAM-dependent MidA family methyltransferase